jgi:dTDP-glucose 4,6-dehydratase
MTIRAFAEHVCDAVGDDVRIEYQGLPDARRGDPARRCPDISRARRVLGWEPRVGLDEGMADTTHWFRAEIAR